MYRERQIRADVYLISAHNVKWPEVVLRSAVSLHRYNHSLP